MVVNVPPGAVAADLRSFLAAGDAANAARDWKRCQENYAQALKLDPSLASIWVQYGHALKEQNAHQQAEAAYRRALEIQPGNWDNWLQLGHVLKLQGRLKQALVAYARAYEIDPEARDPQIELAFLTRIDFAGLGPRKGDMLAPGRTRSWKFGAELGALLARIAGLRHQGSQIRTVLPAGSIELGPKVAVFVHFDPAGRVRNFTLNYVRALRETGAAIVFVSNCPALDPADIAQLQPLCAAIIQRRNIGHDFGAVRDTLRQLGLPRDNTDQLIIANDSVYGPLQPLGPILDRIDFDKADLWGATDSWQQRYHLQSYFLVAGRRALTSAAWSRFWNRLPLVQSRHWVITRYEIGLTQAALRSGLRCAALWDYNSLLKLLPPPEPPANYHAFANTNPAEEARRGHLDRIRHAVVAHAPMNPTAELWRQLLTNGFPFLKRELLRRNPARVADLADWRDVVHSVSTADLAPIEQQLRRELSDRVV